MDVWDGEGANGGHVQITFPPLSLFFFLFSSQIVEYSIPAGRLESKGTTKGTRVITFILHHYTGQLSVTPEHCLTGGQTHS